MTARQRGVALIAPAVLFVAACFLLPIAILLAGSLREASGGLGLGRFVDFFAVPLNVETLWRTLRLGALVTLASAVIGYAAALAIVDASPASRGRYIGLFILPLMVSPIARTYAWVVLLGRTGLVNAVATELGLTDEPLRILFTETAVFLGLVQLFLPLMVLSLVSALENLPPDVVSAARLLGAGWVQAFTAVVLPLTREGLAVGGILVFTGSITAYITPAILGGSKVMMLETLLYQRVSVANDVATASVIATLLIVMSFATNALLRRVASVRPRAAAGSA